MTIRGAIVSIYFLILKIMFPIVTHKATDTPIKIPKRCKPSVRGFVQLSFYGAEPT